MFFGVQAPSTVVCFSRNAQESDKNTKKSTQKNEIRVITVCHCGHCIVAVGCWVFENMIKIKHGSGQSMDLDNPWTALNKPWILT